MAGNTAGNNKSNGIDAIKSIQFVFFIRNAFLDFERYNVQNQSIKSSIHVNKSNIWMKDAKPSGKSKIKSTVIKMRSTIIRR